MIEPIERLSLGRYQGVIDYPEGFRLEDLEVLVDTDGNVAVMWLELPGKPFLVSREETEVGSTYMVAFEDGTTMRLTEQHEELSNGVPDLARLTLPSTSTSPLTLTAT
jgi:hypothetical protein